MGKLSSFPLVNYISKGLTTLVETGTGTGSGVDYARGHPFDRIISCEIDVAQTEMLTRRYAGDSRVEIRCQKSVDFLTEIVPTLGLSVFFLDAHFPAADLGRASYDNEKDLDIRLPLERELDILWDNRRWNDVIIIDDLRIYERGPFEGRNLDEIGYANIARYDAPDFFKRWEATHEVVKRYDDTGYVVMTPKSFNLVKLV